MRIKFTARRVANPPGHGTGEPTKSSLILALLESARRGVDGGCWCEYD